jgi:hypothetical protein
MVEQIQNNWKQLVPYFKQLYYSLTSIVLIVIS